MNKALILAGIALLILAGGAFVLWNQQSQPQPTLTPSSSPSPISSPAPPEIPEDWLTYRNDEFGFEMRYHADWKFEEEERGSTLYRFRLYDVEEDAEQKELHKKCSENLRLNECESASLAWWTTGIHMALMENEQKIALDALAYEWEEFGSYTFFDKTEKIGSLEVVRGFARTRLGQDTFLFLDPAKNIQFLVEDIPSHAKLTEQILSSFKFHE